MNDYQMYEEGRKEAESKINVLLKEVDNILNNSTPKSNNIFYESILYMAKNGTRYGTSVGFPVKIKDSTKMNDKSVLNDEKGVESGKRN